MAIKKKKRVVAKRETNAERNAAKKKGRSSSRSSGPDYSKMAEQVKAAQGTVNSIAASKGLTWDAKSNSYQSSNPVNAGYAKELQRKKDLEQMNKNADFAASKGYMEGDTTPAGTIQPDGTVGQTPPTADWAQQFAETWGLNQNPVDTKGMNEQSTQGEQVAVNDNMAPTDVAATGMAATGGTDVNAGYANAMAGASPAGATGTPVTGATGGYTKIGPAYFQKYSDGLRAVSDPTVISGLKHGTIPYSTGQLDGTTFSKYSVPLFDPAKQAMADANLAAMGMAPEGQMIDQGATVNDTYASVKSKYLLPQDQTAFFEDPMGTVTGMVKKIYEMSGVDQANDVIKDISNELEDLENKRDDEIADVNDNPWLTEGVRLRQIDSIEGRYEDKIANRTNKLKLLEDVRNNAQQQAQFAVGTAISLWDKQRQFQQWQIDNWNEQAQREFQNEMAMKQYNLDAANSKYSTNAKDWLLARENGYAGSFYDWLNPKTSSGSGSGGLGVNGTVSPYQLERADRTLSSAIELKALATANPGIFGRTAALPLPDAVRSAEFLDYRSKLDTLKANIAFSELQAMRDASKTGGALGSIAVEELKLLENSLASLNMKQQPETIVQELQKIEDSVLRWYNAQQVYGGGVYVETAPNGEQIMIIPSQ